MKSADHLVAMPPHASCYIANCLTMAWRKTGRIKGDWVCEDTRMNNSGWVEVLAENAHVQGQVWQTWTSQLNVSSWPPTPHIPVWLSMWAQKWIGLGSELSRHRHRTFSPLLDHLLSLKAIRDVGSQAQHPLTLLWTKDHRGTLPVFFLFCGTCTCSIV